MKRTTVSRRLILRGTLSGAVVTVGLPALEAMLNAHGEALADGRPLPVRLVLWGWAHGVALETWVPKQTGTGDAWSLSPDLAAFAPVKRYLSILSGTNNPKDGHPGMYAMFSGYVPVPNGYLKAIGSTMDRVAAKQAEFDSGSGVRTLEAGVSRNPNSDPTYQALSVNGESSRNKPLTDPAALFSRVFGGAPATATPDGGAPAAATAARPSPWVIDACKEDIARLKARLGARDRQRLDEHLQGVLDLEKQLRAMAAPATAAAPACATVKGPANVTYANDGQHDPDVDRLASVITQVTALALACDRTRIATVAYSLPANAHRFAGYPNGEHVVTHGADWKKLIAPTVPLKMKALARFLEQLAGLAEGAGNVLDNVALFATTDCVDPDVHRGKDMPVIIAGKAGGRLKGNVHHRAAGQSAFVAGATVCQAAGMRERPFGGQVASELLA